MNPSASVSSSLAETTVSSRRAVGWVAAVLALATVAVYLNSLPAPFVFDDIPSIPDNPTLRSLWPLTGPLSPPGEGLTVSGRPVLNLTFAFNLAAHAGPSGIRATNIVIHLAAGLLLLGLVQRTLRQAPLRMEFGAAAWPLAAAITVLWLLHPLETAAVTYIVQRAESLMGFFYLLTLYAFVRGVGSPRPARWFALAWSACLLGMGTKETMVSAPLLVAAYDWRFVGGSWREVWHRRKSFLIALAATWLWLAWLVSGTGARGGMEIVSGATAAKYWATQFRVVTAYLGLAVWPFPLVLDRGVEWARGAAEVVPYAIGIVAAAAGTIVAWTRGRTVALLGVFFFAVLAPTSLVPGGRQTMADHRMYLPLAAVMTLLVLGLYRLAGRRAQVPCALAAVALGLVTAQRNVDYRSTLAIWGDTVAKQPANHWARDNLGNALLEADRPAEALAQYEAALKLEPTDAVHHFNAGNSLVRLGRDADAITQFAEAIRLAPAYLPAHTSLGHALSLAGRFPEAIAHYEIVARAQPNRAESHANLGDALFFAGRGDDAVAEFSRAVQLDPTNAPIAYSLGSILLQVGRVRESVSLFEQALRADPGHAEAHANLGSAFARLGRVDEALQHVREAIRLNPRNPEAHNNLGAIYVHLGRTEEARAALMEALRLAPNHPAARRSLDALEPPAVRR